MQWFLVFPKFTLGGHSGILIGEILLILLLVKSVLFSQFKFRLNTELKLILFLALYYFIISNIPFYTQGVTLGGVLYFCKLFLVLLGYSLIKSSPYNPKDNLFRFIIKPYFLMGIASFIIYIGYKIVLNPSVGEILWGYSLGARLIPTFGLGIDLTAIGLVPVGGGSGNLLGSFSLIALIIIFNTNNVQYKKILISAIFLLVFLALSRGVLITLVLYVIYYFLFKKQKVIYFVFMVVIVVAVAVIWGDQISLVNRISDTVTSKGLDPSSMGRLINYIDGFKAWFSTPYSIIFGIGSDETLLTEKVGAPLIESFYLGLLFSGGVISILIFLIFMVLVTYKRNRNIYYRYLFEYLIFQSIIQWTLVGGDFWGPVNMYIMVVLFALSNQSRFNLKNIPLSKRLII